MELLEELYQLVSNCDMQYQCADCILCNNMDSNGHDLCDRINSLHNNLHKECQYYKICVDEKIDNCNKCPENIFD